MFRKKSIVLSDTEKNSNKKAVLSLEEDRAGIKGILRLYNFPHDLSGISSLGFYVDQKVYKAGLTYKSHMLYEFFIDVKSIPNKFSCAVVNFQNAVASPILYGSSEGSAEDIYGSIISEIAKDNSLKNTEKVLDKYKVGFEEEEQKQIEKEIEKAICESCDSCANCIYKKYFYEGHQTEVPQKPKETESASVAEFSQQRDVFSQKNEFPKKENNMPENRPQEKPSKQPQESKPQQDNEIIFIDRLKPQIDKLFETNPVEDNLQKLIPSSKWVKVEYEDDGDFYVFGLLYDEDENIKFVCYGVPAVFEEEAPKELAGYPIWLPLDKENLQGFGYWLTYQDAATGEPVRAIID